MNMSSSKKTNITIGCQEYLDIPTFGVKKILAKIDTGAYTGALHCEELAVVKVGGKEVLKFRPVNRNHKTYETSEFTTMRVRSASGHMSLRYIVPIQIKLKGKLYDTVIGLSDRSDMRRPMLIGRRFLRENNIIVNVSINSELDDEREIAG